jgi:hypothetical protein
MHTHIDRSGVSAEWIVNESDVDADDRAIVARSHESRFVTLLDACIETRSVV